MQRSHRAAAPAQRLQVRTSRLGQVEMQLAPFLADHHGVREQGARLVAQLEGEQERGGGGLPQASEGGLGAALTTVISVLIALHDRWWK